MSEETRAYHPWFTIIAAFVIVTAAIAFYVWYARVPTPYAAQVLSVNVYPIHRDLSQPTSTEGIGGQNDVYDEVLLLADVRITNVAKIPLYLRDMWADVDLPDESDRSSAASGSDFEKVFIAYPDLQQYKKPPLPRDLTLQPGQQVEGMMIFNYQQMDKAKWDSRTATDIGISFIHQKPLVLHLANQQAENSH
jgi:hypothetical protein